MSQITARGQGSPLGLQASGTFQVSTDTSLATLVGTRWDLSDGRELILVSTPSGTAVAAGSLYQDAAIIANHQSLTVTAVQAYSNNGNTPATVTVTLGGTAVTANQYQGGFLHVNSSTGVGQTLRIASHPAQATTTGSVVVTLEDGPVTALTTASVVSLTPPHGANIIIGSNALTGAAVGVGLYVIAVSSFGFLVAKGLTAANTVTTPASIGQAVMAGASGALIVWTTPNQMLGYAAYGGTNATATMVFLNI